VILCANSLQLTGIVKTNPIYRDSGLSTQLQTSTLPGLDTIDPNDGFTTQTLGRAAAEQLLHGHMPWWNYDEQIGAPLAGAMQSGAFLPFTMLLLLNNGIILLHISLELIAAISTYYLLKKMGLHTLAAFGGGVIYGLNGAFSWFGATNINPLPFLPLLLLGIETAYRNVISDHPRGWALIALAVALMVYAGYPEGAYLNIMFAVVWAIIRCFCLPKRLTLCLVCKLIMGFGTGMLLATPLLIAFLDYLPRAYVGIHSVRNTQTLQTIGLSTLLMPYYYGPIFAYKNFDPTPALYDWWSSVGGYLTALVLFLGGAAGLIVKRERSMVLFLITWVGIGLARIYGLPGVTKVLNYIPGMSMTLVSRYLIPTLTMACAVLVAMLLNSLLQHQTVDKIGRRTALAYTLFWILGLACLAYSRLELKRLHHVSDLRYWVPTSIIWAVVTVTLAATLIVATKKIKAVLACTLVVSLIVIDSVVMFVIPQLSAPKDASIDNASVTYLKEHEANDRFFSIGPIAPNYASYYGIASIDNNNLPISKAWSRYVHSKLFSNVDPYLFNGTTQKTTAQNPTQAFFANIKYYEQVSVKYLIVPVGHVPISMAIKANLTEVYKDQVSVIYQLPTTTPYFSVLGRDCNITATTRDSLVVHCPRPSQLIRTELYMPGWTAMVNGRQVKVRQYDGLVQTINLPSGSSTVGFRFEPPYIVWGYICFGLAGSLIGGIYSWPLILKKLL
jgi:hypothetical protein